MNIHGQSGSDSFNTRITANPFTVFSMDSILKNLAIWIVAGLAIGLVVYFISAAVAQPYVPQPGTAAGNATPQQNNTSPAQNSTLPAQPQKNIGLIVVNADACPSCNSAAGLADQVRQFLNATANITTGGPKTVQSSSDEGKGLIAKYNITRLPALLITGNLSDASFLSQWSPDIGSVESDGVLVSRSLYPPYYDLAAGKVSGKVSGIAILPSNCTECVDGSQYLASLEGPSFGVVFANKTILNASDSEAQAIIARYNVTKLPTVILDSEITAYPFYQEQILPVGTYEGGHYVLRDVHPPYLELPSNSIRGLVDVAYLKNSSCTGCLNITEIGDSLAEMFRFSIKNTTEYEISSAGGTALARKYGITKIPTVLYSSELSAYPKARNWWTSQNNTIESDGWFVFRMVDQLNGTYQNISVR